MGTVAFDATRDHRDNHRLAHIELPGGENAVAFAVGRPNLTAKRFHGTGKFHESLHSIRQQD
jgi:hypothetical protein